MDLTAVARKATVTDITAVAAMQERNGISGGAVEALMSHCRAYPFVEEFGSDFPLGWVLDNGKDIVGFLGNIPLLYDLGGRRIKAAIATAWAVDSAYRGKSLSLMMNFLRQPGVDLWIDGSASPTASQVLTGLRMMRIPIPDYAIPCFWATRPRAFAEAVLKHKAFRAAALLAWPAGILLGFYDILRSSGRGRISSAVNRLPEFDNRWDTFWDALTSGPARLRAVRTKAVMDWRFGAGLRAGDTVILATESAGKLSGYAVLVRRRGDASGMSLYDVADIQALRDNPETIRDLVRAAVLTAREDGIDAVKLLVGTPAKREPLASLRPYTYQLPFWQLYFKAANNLKIGLSSADAWDFSPFETY
jgi:hypothetical protein